MIRDMLNDFLDFLIAKDYAVVPENYKEVIDEYCAFIFDVLDAYRLAEDYFERKLPPRICGYFTEFLFGAYLIWKGKKNKFIQRRFIR